MEEDVIYFQKNLVLKKLLLYAIEMEQLLIFADRFNCICLDKISQNITKLYRIMDDIENLP